MIRLRLCIFFFLLQSDTVSFSAHHFRGCMIGLITGDIYLEHLVQVLKKSPGFLHCKITIFHFVKDILSELL